MATESTYEEIFFENLEEFMIYIKDGNQTAYNCSLSLIIDLTEGMKFDVKKIICTEMENKELAVNSEVGIYKTTVRVEDSIDINCQFAGVFLNSQTPVSYSSVRESMKCIPYCNTVGGPETNKPCIFPFVWKGLQFDKCTDINHPESNNTSELYCATNVDEVTKEMKAWGKCSRTCGYCYGTSVQNVTKSFWDKKPSCIKKVNSFQTNFILK